MGLDPTLITNRSQMVTWPVQIAEHGLCVYFKAMLAQAVLKSICEGVKHVQAIPTLPRLGLDQWCEKTQNTVLVYCKACVGVSDHIVFVLL